jgi:lipopolysaccharide transport system permease protein
MSSPTHPSASTHVVRIEPSRGRVRLGLGEVWEYRELLYFLVWRDVKVRYKQTALGAAWAIIQPFMTMVVFSLFFGRLAGVPSDGVPYPIFSFAALVPWTYFATAIGSGGNSLVTSQNLIAKVYFPRLLIPLAAVITPLVDLAVAFAVLLLLMLAYGIAPTAAVLLVPALLLLAVATALGTTLWLAALNVEYRDVRYVIPFLVQFWLFATPVAYPASLVPEGWRALYGINPMAGVIEGFRWALLGTPAPGAIVFVSTLVVAALIAGGLRRFRRMEGTFADNV